MSAVDMNNYIANQKYLSKLHTEKTAIDESYQPIQWFKVKHECEEPGLMTGITPTNISSTSWNSSWDCIIDARKKCTDLYNVKNKMPYFSIFKNNEGKMQWAIFDIDDEQFNTNSVKSSNFSSIELEHNDLEMNINFKGGDLAFNDKNNISIPSNYTINSGKGSCNVTVKEQISDCGRILQEKKDKCGIAKKTAVTANEQIIQYQLLDQVNLLLGKEGMSNIEGNTNLADLSKKEYGSRVDYSKYGNKKRLTRLKNAIRQTKMKLVEINKIIKHEKSFNYANYEWKKMIIKRNRILKKYKLLLDSYKRYIKNKRTRYIKSVKRHNKSARNATSKMNTAIKKRNCSTRKSQKKFYKKKNRWGRWTYFSRPKRVRCGFVGSGSRELVGYEPNNAFSVFNTDDNVNEGFGSIIEGRRGRGSRKGGKKGGKKGGRSRGVSSRGVSSRGVSSRGGSSSKKGGSSRKRKSKKIKKSKKRSRSRKRKSSRSRKRKSSRSRKRKSSRSRKRKRKSSRRRTIFRKRITAKNKRKHERKARHYNIIANNHKSASSKHKRRASTAGWRAKDFGKQFRRLFIKEGFQSSPNTCNNSGVDANFQISHDNSIHNCNSESVFLKYPSADYKQTIDVIKHRTFTLSDSLLSGITPAVFVSGVGDCNNAENVKNQNLELNYSIKHQKENIKIEELMIDSDGNGVLKYSTDDAGTHTYILGDKSNNVNERRIIMDGNGNIKMNTDVLFTNPIQTDPKYIIDGYTNKNNLSSLKSGQEIRSLKYRLTLGSAWNNSTLFYNTKNNAGNTGVYDMFNQKFKYTEHYHKTKGSTTQNVFILYKIKTYGLTTLLYENRIYANIEKVLIDECDPTKGSNNLCYVRAIKDALVANEPMNETNNVNMNTVPLVTMETFSKDNRYKVKYINNTVLSSVPDTINEIRIFLIKSLTDIHMKISSVMISGVPEPFRGYSTIEGLKIDSTKGVVAEPTDGEGIKTRLRILDDLKAQNDRINTKTNEMKTNADSIRSKLGVLTGYGGTIHDDSGSKWTKGAKYTVGTGDDDVLKPDGTIVPLLKTHDDYDYKNPMIPFIFDVSGTDYYNGKTDGKIDPRAKIDAIDEDLREMLYQQNTLYTIGSITSATFIITAILLARNSS